MNPVTVRASWQIRPPTKMETLAHHIQQELAPVELPVKHHFSHGVYARELTIPAGTMLIGKIHKHENLNIVLRGRIAIHCNGEAREFEAGDVIVSPPGTQRAGYALEDTVWMTVHGTDETDLERIEDMFIAKSYDEYLSFCDTLKLKGV